MSLRSLALSSSLAASLALAACDTSPSSPACELPTQTSAPGDITIRARVTVPPQGPASVRVALGGADEATMGLVRLAGEQALALYRPLAGASTVGDIAEDTKLALTPPAEDCGTGEYEAQAPRERFTAGGDGLILRLTDDAGEAAFDGRRVLEGGAVTLQSTPAEVVVGQPFDLPLDRDLPTVAGDGWTQGWDMELRGDCLVPAADDVSPQGPKDFAYAVDEDQQGSDQRPTTAQKARFHVPAGALAAGSTGCAVTATFVLLTSSGTGGAPTPLPGTVSVRVEATPFTFQLRAASR